MKQNLETFERICRFVGAVVFGWLALYGFGHPVARVVMGAIAAWALFESLTASCPLYAHMGLKKVGGRLSDASLFLLGLLGAQISLAYVWWHAGWEKVSGDFFAKLPDTLAFFASKNPYPVYKTFLTGFATENASLFGYAVEWGQLAVGIGLALAVILLAYGDKRYTQLAYGLSIAALLAGVLMNAAFWLAAGWTGPATASSNVAMFWPQLVLLYVWCVKCREMQK